MGRTFRKINLDDQTSILKIIGKNMFTLEQTRTSTARCRDKHE